MCHKGDIDKMELFIEENGRLPEEVCCVMGTESDDESDEE